MAHEIFISYRRVDSRHSARALHQRLVQELGSTAVFYDVASIDLGAVFPDTLAQAIESAQIVLAVIGTEWQTTLLTNAKKKGVKDYVREELKRAGQRIHRGDRLLLIPVLIDAGKGFDPDAWPAALKKDLAALKVANGPTFDDGSWEADFQRLLAKIKAWRAALPARTKTRDDARAEAQAAVLMLLQHKALDGLAAHWSPDGAAMAQPASKQLRDLRKGIKAWREGAKAPNGDAAVRTRCMAVLTLLARLAVDAESAQAALSSKQPLPCSFKSVAALVRAVAQDQPVVLLPASKGFDVRLDRVADANLELDPGAGLPFVKDLALQFWNALYPADTRQDMSANEIKALASLLRDRTEDDRAPFVVFCPANLGKLDLARAKAEELNAVPLVWAEPAAGAGTVLYEPEHDLVAAMKSCIDEIGML